MCSAYMLLSGPKHRYVLMFLWTAVKSDLWRSFSVALKQLLHVFFIHYGLKYFVVSLFTVIKSFRHTPGIICVPTTYRLSFSFSLRADHLFVPLVKCILRCLLSWRKAENWPGPQLITSLNLLKAPSGFKLQTNAAVGRQTETGRCRMWT